MIINKTKTCELEGNPVYSFKINNEKGLEIVLISYGATLQSVKQADRNGKMEEITLGFDSPLEYYENRVYFGATIGRYGNRIAKGKFLLNSKEYTLAQNNGPNHLHGGFEGFNRKIWDAFPFEHHNSAGVLFKLTSPDGEEGYPGTLEVEMKYTITVDNEIIFEYKGETDQDTVINLTNHAFWNLGGAGTTIDDQEFRSPAEGYIPVDSTLIPLGNIIPVENTPFDFRKEKTFREGFKEIETASGVNAGYDHCFVLPEHHSGQDLAFTASAYHEKSGRKMEIFTDQPGFQLYTCGGMEEIKIAGGKTAGNFGAFCVETQKFPDSPNQPAFPSTVLKKGETYIHRTVHRFSTE